MPVGTDNLSQPAQAVITPADRLGMTLCLAIITHAAVVLGISFAAEETPNHTYDTMEIVLVHEKSSPPDKAKLLAQASLEGGGDEADPVRPASPLPSPFPANEAEITSPPLSAPPAADAPEAEQAVMTANSAEPAPSEPTRQSLAESQQPSREPPAPRQNKELPDASTLIANSLKIAALSAEIERKLETKAERPKRKFISASTSEFLYAAYMEAWRAKIERIGNLNYPDAARQQKLSGSLILDVSLNPDGSINDIVIRRSSGHKILDDAAVRIVNLAGPYAPFPEEIRDETDILHITRTWQFINNDGFY